MSDVTLQARPTPAHRGQPMTPEALEPREGGIAEGIGGRFAAHPLRAAVVVALAGFVLLAALMIGVGLLLIHVLLPAGVGAWDNRVNEWFVGRRTPLFNSWTLRGSEVAMTPTVIGLGVVIVAVLAIARRWRELQFIVIAVAVEASAFLVTTLVIQRPRPTVHRLDASPPTSSFPSGHVAAGIALYIGLAILLSSHVRNTAVRALIWIVAIAIPFAIAVSRVYRGMHHPTDVLASLIVLGPCSLAIALLAARSASAAAPPEEVLSTGEAAEAARARRVA
jgi:membrane-associated phospholipid phosphatase